MHRRALGLVPLALFACGKPAPPPPGMRSTVAVPGPNPLCNSSKLPPLGLSYCLSANRSENPKFQPAAFDINGSCPTCRYSLRTDGDGVALVFAGDVPFQWRPQGHNQAGGALIHHAGGSLRGLTTSFSRIAASAGTGTYQAEVAVQFFSSPTPGCPVRHHWLGVALRPISPLVPRQSRDVVYHGPAERCGGMFVFDATGPTVHWTPGGPLTLTWCQLLDAIHAKGVWLVVSCDDTSGANEFVVATGFTPGGREEPLMTGGVTVRFAGWTSSR